MADVGALNESAGAVPGSYSTKLPLDQSLRPDEHDRTAPSTTSHSEHDESPVRSGAGDTRPSSADEERSHDSHNGGQGEPSTTGSGSSSVSGGGAGQSMSQTTLRKGPQSFFSGSKIKHLKKQDGVPLWRADIQYEFLQSVFLDETPVFTNVYTQEKGQTFSDVYVDAMARSSKTSKILRDKLRSEKMNALNMAMVCLLVNVGRMNTTLNFFPEMKAQLRTYHAIPSLQAHTDSNAYKQLQDAPRLKSILKGACEDRKEPQTLEEIIACQVPRTNPINLIFVLSTYAPKISEQHFPENLEFYDLVMRSTLSSKSRAKAFLWLMWLYLESDFSPEACMTNPFGKGVPSKTDPNCLLVPEFEYLTEEQAAKENVDTEFEQDYGEKMRIERKRLIGDQHTGLQPSSAGRGRGKKTAATPDDGSPAGSPPPGSVRSSRGQRSRYSFAESYYDESDARTRSVSPDAAFHTPVSDTRYPPKSSTNVTRIPNILNTDAGGSPLDPTVRNKGGRPKNSSKRMDGEIKPAQRIILKSGGKHLSTPDASGHMAPATRSVLYPASDRSSPMMERGGAKPRMTSHQLAVQQNRQDRVDHMIDRDLRRRDWKKKRIREKEGAIVRAWRRIKNIDDPLMMSDSELSYPPRHASQMDEIKREDADDQHSSKRGSKNSHGKHHSNFGSSSRGPAGLISTLEEQMGDSDDYGEEAMSLAAALRRTRRRLERWQDQDRRRVEAGLALNDMSRQEYSEMPAGESAGYPTHREGIEEAEGGTDDDEDEDMMDADDTMEWRREDVEVG